MSSTEAVKGTILVIDDEEEIRLVLYTLLEDVGYDVRVASDGEEAIDMLREQSAEVIIADYKMPEMNGLEFLEATWEFSPRPKTIILTGNADIDMAMDAARHGVVTIVTKPFVADELLDLIAKTFAETRETKTSLSDSTILRRKSAQLLSDSKEFVKHIQKQIGRLETNPNNTETKVEHRTYGFGPSGFSKLANIISITDLKPMNKATGRGGIFVDDGQEAVLLTIINSICVDGKTIKLKCVSGDINFGKLYPVSLLHPNFLHFRDENGDLIKKISCVFDYKKDCIEELPDPYEILQIDPGSSSDEVKKAYEKMLAVTGLSLSSDEISRLNEAYKRVRQHLRNLESHFTP